jgi:hypothetical protein
LVTQALSLRKSITMAIIERVTLLEKEKLEQMEGPSMLDVVQPESQVAKYIPGGYSKSRCVKLRGRPIMYAVLLLAGISIMFFGYDASVIAPAEGNESVERWLAQ